ncbi:MAG TPA: ABC transporter substrate-binding protein [Candidatus Binatia bacterium]|nr:ABC transporter substrate-binding protein [Candidatus Binatia bacterium]
MRAPTTFAGLFLGIAALGLVGCATSQSTSTGYGSLPPPGPKALVVGVTSDAPPYAVRRGTELGGLEVDFARALSEELRRPLTLVDLGFSEQIPALGSGRIDIIMAGMTVTRARELRIAFAEPYLRAGLVAVMRRGEMDRYKTVQTVMQSNVVVGVVESTTGDKFVRENMQASQVIVYPTAAAAVGELRQNRIDLLVTDAPVAAWFVSLYESDLGVLTKLLNVEPLAWGMRRDDEELVTATNAALAKWRSDGTLDRILTRWVPFWRQLIQGR